MSSEQSRTKAGAKDASQQSKTSGKDTGSGDVKIQTEQMIQDKRHSVGAREAKNFIQATGLVDAAARTARMAEEYETQKEFTEAIKMHDQAASLYEQAAQNLLDEQKRATGKSGHQRTPTEIKNEKELIMSFNQLSKTHFRQKKFLLLRQKDPDSLYDVSDIRARLAPKRRALQDKKMLEKGMIRKAAATNSSLMMRDRSDSTKQERSSLSSPSIRLLQNGGVSGESHLPGEVTNPDEQLYQFVTQKNLYLAQRSMRDVMKEVQTEIELSISTLTSNTNEINGWVKEAIDEQKRLVLKRSRVVNTNDPFLKAANQDQNTDQVLGPNSLVRVKKSQLDHLIGSLKSNQVELENLKMKVEQRKTHSNAEFIAINKSLVYKHNYLKDKPFVLTLHQIKQLASTPVGYGLRMLEVFDLTQNQLEQQKHAIQQRLDMEKSIMMQSSMPQSSSDSMAMTVGGLSNPNATHQINPASFAAPTQSQQQKKPIEAVQHLQALLSKAEKENVKLTRQNNSLLETNQKYRAKYEEYKKRENPDWKKGHNSGSSSKQHAQASSGSQH